jgi:ubiquinone/menaquinone biosynthesis C-methylase UbiE
MSNINKKQKWWESEGGFFGSLYKEADDSFEGHLNEDSSLSDRTEREVSGVIKLCALNSGDALIDCPSGYGRHSIALSQRGLKVTGVDINDEFLNLARNKANKKKLTNVNFVKCDMRKIDYTNKFDAVINMFYSFGFFESEDENFLVLKNFFNALKDGGEFLMHTHVTVPRLVSGELKNSQTRDLESGKKLQLTREYNSLTKREDGEWAVVDTKGNKDKLTPYSVRIYTADEFEKLCLDAGFKSVKSYGSWEGDKYKDSSPELIVVATK